MPLISITGAGGNMGKASVEYLLQDPDNRLRLFLRRTKADKKLTFDPNWNPPRNFHCFWFSDSDELEKRFHSRKESCADFWKCYSKKHFIYGAGKIVPPKILRKLIIESLHKDENAPMYWYEHNDVARIQAFFGGEKEYNELPKIWEDTKLFCKSTDYNDILNNPDYKKLDHGYDESKNDADLNLSDMKQAATFRGGKCISNKMKTGDLYSKLRWRCHDGHEFDATPYTILKTAKPVWRSVKINVIAGKFMNEDTFPS